MRRDGLVAMLILAAGALASCDRSPPVADAVVAESPSPEPEGRQAEVSPAEGPSDPGAALEAGNPAAAGMDEAFRLIEAWLEAQRQYRAIPAISAAVVKGDATVWAKGFGTSDRAGKVPATADTIYSICSISKLFTSIAVMQQWEQGRVRLDGQLTDYISWAQLAPDERDSVPLTLRAVLSHSSGLPREADFPYWTAPDFAFPSNDEIEARIGRQDMLFPSSREFQYSNLGITLLGNTVEAVSGEPYDEYVRRHIIDPLGLRDTRPGIPADRYGQQMAVGWGVRGLDGKRPPIKLFDPAGITPAAGFSSTANDLARFAAWHFRLLRGQAPEVIRASTLREMLRVQFVSPDWKVNWGLGYMVLRQDPQTFVGHGGSCPGYRTILMMDPANEVGVAVLTNAMDNPQAFATAIGAVLGKRIETKSFAASGQVSVDLSGFAGLYDSQPWAADVAVVPWAGGLAVAGTDATNPVEGLARLKHVEGDRFVVVDDRGTERDPVVFERDAAGRVAALVRHSNRLPLRPAL